MLTDEQCMEFRRMPGSFNDMVRAIHAAGVQAERERCARVAVEICGYTLDDEPRVCCGDHIAAAIREGC